MDGILWEYWGQVFTNPERTIQYCDCAMNYNFNSTGRKTQQKLLEKIVIFEFLHRDRCHYYSYLHLAVF